MVLASKVVGLALGFEHSVLEHILDLTKRCPSYLANLVIFNMTYSQRRQLRSSTTEPLPYDAPELSSGSVHFLFAVLMCGIAPYCAS